MTKYYVVYWLPYQIKIEPKNMDLLLPNMGLLFWTIFSSLIILLPIIALFSLLKSIFKDSKTKLIWVLVILFVPVAGPILYFLIDRRQRVKIALLRWLMRRVSGDTNPGEKSVFLISSVNAAQTSSAPNSPDRNGCRCLWAAAMHSGIQMMVNVQMPMLQKPIPQKKGSE